MHGDEGPHHKAIQVMCEAPGLHGFCVLLGSGLWVESFQLSGTHPLVCKFSA